MNTTTVSVVKIYRWICGNCGTKHESSKDIRNELILYCQDCNRDNRIVIETATNKGD